MINNFNSNFNDKRENASKVMDERPIQGVSRKWEEHIESTITNSNENQKFINTVS